MTIIPFRPKIKHPTQEEAELAAELRRLADDVERGDIAKIITTVIREDGEVERLGNISPIIKPGQ